MSSSLADDPKTLEIIQRIVNKLAWKYRFGYLDVDDIKQEGTFFALQALDKYDGSHPLENFLYIHVRNRLSNYKRDKYYRLGPPCSEEECPEKYRAWEARNNNKKNIMEPININLVRYEQEENMMLDDVVADDLDKQQMQEKIDKELPVKLRMDYLKLKDGVKIPKYRQNKVVNALKEILVGTQEG